MSGESGNREESAHEQAVQRSVGLPSAREEITVCRSASLAPLLVLYQQAWEWAQRTDLSLELFFSGLRMDFHNQAEGSA